MKEYSTQTKGQKIELRISPNNMICEAQERGGPNERYESDRESREI